MTNWFLTRDEALEVAYTVNETDNFPEALLTECRVALAKATAQFEAARAAAYTSRRTYLYNTMRFALDDVEATNAEKLASVRRLISKLGGEEIPVQHDYLSAATGRLADILAALNVDDAKFDRFVNFAFNFDFYAPDTAADILKADTEDQRLKNCAAILALARLDHFSLIRRDVTADEIATMLVYADGYRALQKAEAAGELVAGTAKAVVNIGLLALCVTCYIGVITLGFMAMEASVVLGIIVMMALWMGGTVPLIMLDDQEDTVQEMAAKLRPALYRLGAAMGSRELAELAPQGLPVQAIISATEDQTVQQQVMATVNG